MRAPPEQGYNHCGDLNRPSPNFAKTLNFFVATSASRLLTAKLKDFARPSRDAVIARCSLGLRSGRLRGAVFHHARSLRCAQNAFAKHLEIGAEYRACPSRASPLADCAHPFLPHRLRVGLWGIVIICAVLVVLSAVPIPRSHSESRTPLLRVRRSSRKTSSTQRARMASRSSLIRPIVTKPGLYDASHSPAAISLCQSVRSPGKPSSQARCQLVRASIT